MGACRSCGQSSFSIETSVGSTNFFPSAIWARVIRQWSLELLWLEYCGGLSHEGMKTVQFSYTNTQNSLRIVQASQSLWRPCEWANSKPFLRSQHNMVANSLMWWFQSLEKAQTSLYVWIHNIIWIYIKIIHILWIHALGIHVYHMNSYIWICFKWIPIFLTDVSCWSSVLCRLSLKIFFNG